MGEVLKVRILAVGRLKEAYWKDAEAEYRKRLRRYVDAQVVEVKDEAALLAGDAETGVSIMRMEAGMDTGPVWAVSRTPIAEGEDAAA